MGFQSLPILRTHYLAYKLVNIHLGRVPEEVRNDIALRLETSQRNIFRQAVAAAEAVFNRMQGAIILNNTIRRTKATILTHRSQALKKAGNRSASTRLFRLVMKMIAPR